MEGVGAEVDPGRVGTRVMASTTRALAEYALADHRHAIPVPDEVPWEEAAALPTAMLTEHGALRAGGFTEGASVLVTGATSAIALVGLQIARELGASTVIGTSRSWDEADLLRGSGADVIVMSADGGVEGAILEATGGEGVDVVLDHVGSTLFADLLTAVARHGTVVQVGRLDPTPPTVDLDVLAYRRLTLRRLVRRGGRARRAARDRERGLDRRDRRRSGPSRRRHRHRLDDADEGADRVRHGRARGKVVLRPSR